MPVVPTDRYRTLIADATAGRRAFAAPAVVAYGDGGADQSGTVRVADPARTSLRREHTRTPVLGLSVNMPGEAGTASRVNALCAVTGDQSGEVDVSELGLFDEEGSMLLYACFTPRALIAGTRLDFRLVLDIQHGDARQPGETPDETLIYPYYG